MELDSLGNLGKFYGDLPFEEFWNEAPLEQIGIFGIVFPEKSIAMGPRSAYPCVPQASQALTW